MTKESVPFVEEDLLAILGARVESKIPLDRLFGGAFKGEHLPQVQSIGAYLGIGTQTHPNTTNHFEPTVKK